MQTGETAHAARAARGPVRTGERALAPDLARGLMLLLIVTSNTMFFLWGAEHDGTGQHVVAATAPDAVAQFAMAVVLDMRVYPLFAFLFGYGMWQLYTRQTAAGGSALDAVRLLRRRSLWLVVFGAVHAALLLASDILAAYGVISLVLGALFLRRGDRALVRWSAIGAALLGLVLVAGIAQVLAVANWQPTAAEVAQYAEPQAAVPELTGTGEDDYLRSVVHRLGSWLALTALPVFGVTAPVAMLLGILTARRGILEHPERHLGLLRRAAVLGIAVCWLGGLPTALVGVGVLDLGHGAVVASPGLLAVQYATGLAGGVGYVALFGLLAHRLSDRARRGVPVAAVTAVGRRSLSCYLTHSLLLGPVLAAWGLGLGAQLGNATGVLYAVGAWLVTCVGAYLLDRAGRRGPAEVVLRRLVYPKERR